MWGVLGGVGCSSIDLSALAVQSGESGWAWGLFDSLMWGVCGVAWAAKGVHGSDDSFCGMGVFNLGLQHKIHRIWLCHLCCVGVRGMLSIE